ncbi:MAG: hypothetical protein WBZ36_14125 [Candidatus Nitrosopolaris sp.]|jgi:hypothetical protein
MNGKSSPRFGAEKSLIPPKYTRSIRTLTHLASGSKDAQSIKMTILRNVVKKLRSTDLLVCPENQEWRYYCEDIEIVYVLDTFRDSDK